MERVKISIRQFQLLVIFFTVGTTILIIPAGLAAEAKQDAWIAAIGGIALGLLVILFYTKLGKQMKEMDFVEYCQAVLGKIAGSAVALLFVFIWFIGAVTLLAYVGNFFTTQVLVETPIQFIHMLFVVIVVMALRLGLETIARAAEIFAPWIILLLLALMVLVSPEIQFEFVRPVFETDFKSLFRAGITVAATAALPFISFFMIYPSVQDRVKRSGAFLSAAMVGGGIIIGISWLTISVLGADVTERLAYPSYVLAKKINIANFIQRVEIIIAAIWILTIYFKMILYFYACVTGLARVAGLKRYQPLVLPLGLLLVVYGHVVYPNINYMNKWDKFVWVPLILTFGLIIPLMLYAAGRWKISLKRRTGGNGKANTSK